MKRSTLIVLVLAAALGAAVYFLEIKKDSAPSADKDTSKAVFNFASGDIEAMTISRGGQDVVVENHDGKWSITQPFTAPADEVAVNSLAGAIASSRSSRTLTASADDIKAYGLDPPAVTVEIKLKNGEQHSVALGVKDFAGLTAYAIVDGSQSVTLLPAATLTDADKSADDLRDKSVLGASQYEMSEITLTNAQGQIKLIKDGANWKLKAPVEGDADDSKVSSMLSQLGSAKAAEFVKEAGGDQASYGLDKPAVTLTARLQNGGEQTLAIGSKSGEQYFAKSSNQKDILKVESSLFDDLNVKPADLRDKRIVKVDKTDLTGIEIKNTKGGLTAAKDNDGKWMINAPADSKGKELKIDKVADAFSSNKASEILDKPAPAVAAKLAKPSVELRLTGKDGKTTSVSISAADGDNVYVRVNGRPEIYKAGKQLLDDLDVKAADLVS